MNNWQLDYRYCDKIVTANGCNKTTRTITIMWCQQRPGFPVTWVQLRFYHNTDHSQYHKQFSNGITLSWVAVFGMESMCPNYTLRTTKLFGGILVSLHPSVCPSVRPSIRPSDRSASRVCSVALQFWIDLFLIFIYTLSNNFRRCDVCKVYCKIEQFKIWHFFIICNFDFVFFWLESDVNQYSG